MDPGLKVVIMPQASMGSEHPYQKAKDAIYTLPDSRNIGGPVKVPLVKSATPAYKALPLVHNPAIALDVYKRSMSSPVTITQHELLSISPKVRTYVRDSTTTRRVPAAPAIAIQGSLLVVPDEDEVALEVYQTLLLGHPA